MPEYTMSLKMTLREDTAMSHQQMTQNTSSSGFRKPAAFAIASLQCLGALWAMLVLLAGPAPVSAQPADLTSELSEARRVFIPAEDLDVVVERDHRGAMLTRKKFDELITLAKANAAKAGPNVPIVLTSANYQTRIVGDQLLISVTAEMTQFANDWQSLSFGMQRLSVEKATLDDAPAMLGRNQDGSVSLLSDEKGKHVLKLEMSTELTSQGSDQIAAFSLLRAPSGTLSLTLPAGKRLLVGSLQLERPAPLEQAADYKIAIGGAPGMQLRITDRAAENAADALTFATTGYGLHVAPGEVTWHALTTMQIFGKPVDRLTFSIPSTLEIADVEATGLEAWELNDDPNDKKRTIISLTFGQAFDGQRKISFKGVMAVEMGTTWAVPPLTITNVTSHIGQVLVQHPAGVRLRIEETEGVRRATAGQKPTTDMPDEMAKMNATEFLRFDVWQPDFVLRLTTQPKQREVQTAVAAVLDVNATGLDLQALLTVTTHFAPLFELDVRLPADWTVLSAQRDGVSLKWQLLSQDPGVNQLRVLLDPPLAAEATGTVRLAFRREVEGWPVENTPISVDLPELFLPQSSLNEGTFVVRGDDDLDLTAFDLSGLDTIPLQADFERLRFQSQDTRYGGKLKVTRKPSRISVQTITFGRLDPQTMHAFLQAMLEVQGGGVRSVKISLPESAGTLLRFQSPMRPIVEQKPGAVQGGARVWTLQFDQRVRGVIPLFCDIELPRGAETSFVVPQAKFVDAERQNGFLAVEAGGEQRLTIDAKGADGSPLTEVDPLDLPNVYYIPKERIVAVYRNVTAGATLTLGEERFDKLAVPTAVCPMLSVTSILGRTGELQHRADFQLIAVGVQGLRVTLPRDTLLWATMVDGRPVEVRRHGDIYLVPLNTSAMSAQDAGQTRQLQLFYRSEVPALTQFGTIEQPPPELAVQTGQGTSQPVDVLDQRWSLHYPSKTLLVDSDGPMEPEQAMDETSLLTRLNSGVRIPTLTELSWQLFAVLVTLGVIAFFVTSYRKGIAIFVGAVAMTMLIGFVTIYQFTAQDSSSAKYSEYHSPPAPMMSRPAAPKSSVRDGSGSMSPTTGLPNVDNSGLPLHAFGDVIHPGFGTTESAPAEPALAMPTPEGLNKNVSELARQQKDLAAQAPAGKDALWDADVAQMPAQDPKAPANAEPFKADDAARPNMEGRKDHLGLMSLAIDLTPTEGSVQKTFRYVGSDPARGGIGLHLDYVDEQSGAVVRIFLVALVALIGWFLRHAKCATKLAIAGLGLTVPLALLPLAPQSLQIGLDGIFFGVLVTCGLWFVVGAAGCAQSCWQKCCGRTSAGTSTAAVTAGAWILVSIALSGSAFAQPQAQQPAAKPESKPEAKQETTLIVPFDAGTNPLEADRILLPYDKFIELYRQAYPDKPFKGTAPSTGGIVEALYSAKIIPNEKTPDESTARITARFAVRSYVDGQFPVELPLGEVAAISAKLDGKNAPLIVQGVCSKVVIPTPGLHVIDFVFSVPARLSGSTGSVTLPLTPVPSGKLSLELPAKDLSIRINGSSTIFRKVTQGDVQTIEVPIDKGGDLSIVWQPEQARGAAAAVVHVDSVQAITLTDAGVRVSTGFQYRVRQGSVADVTFSLPATYRLQAVNGADVGGWELQGEGDARKLRVIFRRNITDTTQLTVESFLVSRVGVESTVLEIPQIAPFEVTNEIGQVAVFAGSQFTLRADKVESLTQVDADKFTSAVPVSRPNVAPQLAYRFSKRPFALSLRVARQESQATVVAQQAAFVMLRKQQLTTRLLYNLTGAPRSSFNIALPPGYVVLDVKATGLHDWSLGKQGDETSLTIDLDGPRLGQAEVVLSGTVPRDNNETSATLVFPKPLDATKLSSTAAVWLDEGFAGTLDSFDGWRSVDAALVSNELKAVRPNHPVQFAFQSTASASAITVKLQRATPKLAANGLAMVSVTDVAVVHTLALQWQIDAATTDSLVFTTPSFLAGKLEFTGSGIRETTHVDAGNGRTRWTIWLRTPVSGKYFAAAIATMPPAATEVVAPSIVFERGTGGAAGDAVEGQRQYVLLINLSQSQLTSAAPELSESVQKEDVPVVVDQSLVDQATELVRVKQLLTAPRWTLQTFAQTASAPASVNVADLTTIISHDGSYRGQAIYTIKNRSRQFLALRLPENTMLMSVFVGNVPSRAVTTKRNNQTMQLIALPKTSAASLSFPVRVVWRGSLSGALSKSARLIRQEMDIPAPVVVSQQEDADFGIPVARTRWTVWLPDDLDVKPLTTSARHNLTLQSSDEHDLLYEKAAVQEMSELIGYVEQNYSFGSTRRGQATNNLKQIGLAFNNAKQLEQSVSGVSGDPEFERQRSLALKRLSDLQQSVVADQQKAMQSQVQQPMGNNVSSFNGSLATVLEQESLGQTNGVLLGNNATLLDSNVIAAPMSKDAGGEGFSFQLESRGENKKSEQPSDKPAAGKSSGAKVAGQATRQQLQIDNRNNIDALNESINQQKAIGQQGQQGQFGGQPQGRGRNPGYANFSDNPVGQPGGGPQGGAGPNANAISGMWSGNNPQAGQAGQGGFGGGGGAFIGQFGGLGMNGPGVTVQDERNVRGNVTFNAPNSPSTAGSPYGIAINGNGAFGIVAPNAGAPGSSTTPRYDAIRGGALAADAGLAVLGFAQADGILGANPAGGMTMGRPQTAGLSLGFALPAKGQKLVFSKAGGDPKLALAVRPAASVRQGLNLVWAAVWLAIGIAIAAAARSAGAMGRLTKQAPIAAAALGILGFVVLPAPLSGCAFATFVIAALIIAWMNRKAKTAV